MAKNLGTFTFAANFQVKAAEALDPRMVAATKADLINKENWPSDGDTIYVYKGLIVDCGEDGVYRLIDPTKALASDYSGWQRIDAGGVQIDNIFTYKGNVENYESLPENPNIGDVYNVESDFTITTQPELGSDEQASVKTYFAGTNVAWNGNSWDPLAGSIDMAAYATKEEVSEIRTNVANNVQAISGLSTALGETNEAVAKKVDAVEGSTLIPVEKLELIDTNASDIKDIQDLDLDNRLKTVESAFTGEGGTIDLGDITSSLTSQGNRITALETDNTNNKTNIESLQTTVGGHSDRLNAIEQLNTTQENSISTLTTDLANVKSTADTNAANLTILTGTVNGQAEEIANIKTSISGISIKSVAPGDLVLSSNDGVLSSTIKLNYDENTRKIQLKGISDTVISEFDASIFIKDGMLNNAEYDTETKEIVLTWNDESGKDSMRIPMGSLVDIYTAGAGLQVNNNQFAVKLDPSLTNKLTTTENGLMVDITSELAAMEGMMDTKIASALEWEDVK